VSLPSFLSVTVKPPAIRSRFASNNSEIRTRVPGAFASRLVHDRDTLSSLAIRGDVDADDDGDGAVVFLIYISAAWLRLDLVAVYFRRTFTGLRNRVGFSGVTSFAAVLSGSVESAR
jgi:hypothetical protein